MLFLDIDGVLHPGHSGSLCKLPLFAEWLKARPEINIVISSDWRIGRTLSELRELLPGIPPHRIIGATVHWEDDPELPDDWEVMDLYRFKEIEIYLKRQGPVSAFAVLDDSPRIFPKEWPPLVITDRLTGVTSENLAMLERLLNI